jgi:hypothetical protein
MRDSHVLSCYKNDFMINSYDAAHDPQKKFRSRSAALPTHKNGRLGLITPDPRPAPEPTMPGRPGRPAERAVRSQLRTCDPSRWRDIASSSEHEVRRMDRAFHLPQPTKHASASDRSRLALGWNIRSRVVSRAYGSAARADHVSLARNSFLNFRTIGEKSWRRIRQ